MNVNQRLEKELSNAAAPSDSEYPGVLPCQKPETGLYPNVDLSIWLRSCTQETERPLRGTRTGQLPDWLEGSFLQNGPGKLYFGSQRVRHLFDGSGLLQKYFIEKGEVYYQCRFIRSKNFTKNLEAQKVITNEFATVPSGTKKWNDMLSNFTDLSKMMSDNCFITVQPLGEDYYCFYESPFIQQIDPDTLETLAKIDLNSKLGLLTNASHPHYDEHGNMISIGMKVGLMGPEYVVKKTIPDPKKTILAENDQVFIVKGQEKVNEVIPTSAEKFGQHHILTKIRSRFMLDPSYMHSFAMTGRYFILIEQPLTVSVPKMVSSILQRKPFIGNMRWRPELGNIFHVIDRVTGERVHTNYKSNAFFFLHTINAYEENNHLIVDISCYEKPDMLECMFLDQLQNAQSKNDYADLFRGRPQRYVIPLNLRGNSGENLVTLGNTSAKAICKKGEIHLIPEQICDVGCETPTIFYERYNGKKYRYFYAITSDVDDPESAGKIYKVDTKTHEVKTWYEKNTYCAEPMFVPNPTCQGEDDGIIISSMIRGRPEVKYTALLVLDAKSMTEIARAEFECGSPVPKPLHGYFTGNNISQKRAREKLAKL